MSHDTSSNRAGAPRTQPSEPAGPFSATAGLSSTVALVADIVAVLAFTLVGSLSHNGTDGFSIGGWLQTSWPFILGLAVGWALLYTGKLRRAPGTGLIGIVVRSLVNMSVAWGFVITSLIFLGIVMIGWRLIASLVTRRARS
ncbi:MAG: DUF3054 domain-containing protein [Candidatus Corynebacterium faecigallinarum]